MTQLGVPPQGPPPAPLPPGLYHDSRTGQQRWWDGYAWGPTGQPAAPPPKKSATGKVLLVILLVGVVGLGVFALVRFSGKDGTAGALKGGSGSTAPAANVVPLGTPFTLRTCSERTQPDSCPLRVVVQHVNCGLPPLADQMGPVDRNLQPTETLLPKLGQFCAIKYQITNTSADEMTLIAMVIKLVDGQGRTFGESQEMGGSSSARAYYGIETTMGLQPTQTALAAELFDVPADATITKVVFKGGFGHDEVAVAVS